MTEFAIRFAINYALFFIAVHFSCDLGFRASTERIRKVLQATLEKLPWQDVDSFGRALESSIKEDIERERLTSHLARWQTAVLSRLGLRSGKP